MRQPLSSVLVLLIAASGCARHGIPPVVLTPQTHIGPADDYGLRITDLTATDLDFTLDKSAYVIALRVTRPGVGVVVPRDGAPRFEPGSHYLRAVRAASAVEDSDYIDYTRALPLLLPCSQFDDQTAPQGSQDNPGCPNWQPNYPSHHRVVDDNSASDLVGYWLLIASDAPIRVSEIRRRIGGIQQRDAALVNVVRGLPERLLASRTTHWGAYYAPFGDANDP